MLALASSSPQTKGFETFASKIGSLSSIYASLEKAREMQKALDCNNPANSTEVAQ